MQKYPFYLKLRNQLFQNKTLIENLYGNKILSHLEKYNISQKWINNALLNLKQIMVGQSQNQLMS